MIKFATQDLRTAGRPVGSVVVVGLGYNSLWQKDRQRYAVWAGVFDHEAEQLISTLTSLGAHKIVWVTLRNASAGNVPPSAQWQQQEYAWYFPYVNEQLHLLAHRSPDLSLADWAAVSNRPGLTYDAIHLDPVGARLMTQTIKAALGI